MGFYQKKSNDIVAFDHCPVLHRKIQGVIEGMRPVLSESVQGIRSIELHAPGNDCILQVKVKGGNKNRIMGIMENMCRDLPLSGISFVNQGERKRDYVQGSRYCTYSLNIQGREIRLSTSFGEFIQANTRVNEALVSHVYELAQGSGSLLDLYCGSGNFSIPLSLTASDVTAVEMSSSLVSQGKFNAKKNRAGKVEFRAMDAHKAVLSFLDERKSFSTIVLDPPREGAKQVAEILPGLKAERIIYISCNPTTLARDLKPLVKAGYKLKNLRLFDMFPQTYHIESVVCLER